MLRVHSFHFQTRRIQFYLYHHTLKSSIYSVSEDSPASCAQIGCSDLSAFFRFPVWRLVGFSSNRRLIFFSLGMSLASFHVFSLPEVSHHWCWLPQPSTSFILPHLACAIHVFIIYDYYEQLVGILMQPCENHFYSLQSLCWILLHFNKTETINVGFFFLPKSWKSDNSLYWKKKLFKNT